MKLPLPTLMTLAAVLLAPAARAVETSTEPGEPRVQRIVVEDTSNRIDELRVRGQAQRIVVTPKGGSTKPYEIITGDGSRDLGAGANTSRGAVGQRVWQVLSF